MDELYIIKPDDMHIHLRDNELLPLTLAHAHRQFARVLAMPNLIPPLTSVTAIHDYAHRINQHPGPQVLYSLYLTDNTRVRDIYQASEDENIIAVKWYPAGATTHADAGVTNIKTCYPVLQAMSETGLVLSIHGEVTDQGIDIFNREKVFIERELIPLRARFPQLKIVLEHISTAAAAEYIARENSEYLAATITPQHLLIDRNDLLAGGIKPHYYCLPVVKKSSDREALVQAAISGAPFFFLGTDSAPHDKKAKESACGCAGCYAGDYALALYTTVFDRYQSLDKLENFASVYGRSFYQLDPTEERIRLIRKKNTLTDQFSYIGGELIPFFAGAEIDWQIDDEQTS